MAIDGNSKAGRQIELATPKILVNGVEIPGGVHTNTDGYGNQSDVVTYLYSRKNDGAYYPVTTLPAVITFTTTDDDVDLYYTFNGRTPHADPASGIKTHDDQKFHIAGKYNPSNPPRLYQNTTGDGTVIKVRAFKKHGSSALRVEGVSPDTNSVSKIAKGEVNVVGGNTVVTPTN